MDIIKIVVYSILVINLLLGVGNHFARRFESESGMALYGEENLTIIEMNSTQFANLSQQISQNPTTEGIAGALYNAYEVLYGIPVTVTRIGTLAMPGEEDLFIYINVVLIGIVSLVYFLFVVKVVGYII